MRFFRGWFVRLRQRSHEGFNTEDAVVNVLMTVMLSTVEGDLLSFDGAYDDGAFIHITKKTFTTASHTLTKEITL
jgi:hypothetical protein